MYMYIYMNELISGTSEEIIEISAGLGDIYIYIYMKIYIYIYIYI